MGKTSLIERFLDGLREHEPAVILTGRCYESESVPFKALDSLMDRLSEYLIQEPEDVVQTLLPHDMGSLARVFPVFPRVDAVARMPVGTDASDERELRRRALGALRELLTRLSRRPLVLFIDDLQWGDIDSAVLLAELLGPPNPPALLFLGAYRSELAETSPFLQTFRRVKDGPTRAVEQRELAVAPLNELPADESKAAQTAWTTLRSSRLIRSARRAGQDVIEPYHDRIRETVAGHLAPAVLRQHHGRLAQVLEAGGQAEPETLGIHFQGAGNPVRAARYYAMGGDQAAETLAFDHAARLYGLALDLGAWSGAEAAALHAKRGDALANAGRGPESAAAYLRAANGTDPGPAMELRRRAAYQYCASGHTALGRGVLEGVLRSVGMAMPRTLWQAILSWRLDDPYALGLVHLVSGMNELCVGRWPSACNLLKQAIAIFQQRCHGVVWERGTAELFLLRCLLMMGEFAEAERLSAPLLKDARERGDLYAAVMNGAYVGANVCLAADDVAAARGLVRELVGEWPSKEFNIQQLHALWGETCIDLYCEDGAAAWDRLSRVWPLTREPQNVQLIHIWMLSFRARSALAAAHQAPVRDRASLLGAAEADARRLERTKIEFAAALAQLFRAGVASSRGDQATARRRLTRAIESLDAVAMHSYAAAARWRLGTLLGSQEGRALVDQADSWMRSRAIRNPARMVALHAPGFRS